MQDLNILIVGAGIAGLTAAGLLKKQGANIKIIEKEPETKFNTSGYMLGILPLGGRVVNELDLTADYHRQSIEMRGYEIHKENGKLNKAYDLDFINKAYGSYRGIGRKELIKILTGSVGKENIAFDTTIKAIDPKTNNVSLTFSNDDTATYDLVIVADGLHSATRSLLWHQDEYEYYDTHWGGWVAWISHQQSDTYKEYWGAGSFMGMYPIKDHMGLFLGGPTHEIKKRGVKEFVQEIKNEVLSEYKILHQALDNLAQAENPFFWNFQDVKTKTWNKGNVILLGDAACGFLPTAGVGASMAMDSAAALVDELSRADNKHLEYALKLYVKRQQKRVEKAQQDSRDLGKLMFVENSMIAKVRDYTVRFYTLKQLVKNISQTLEGK